MAVKKEHPEQMEQAKAMLTTPDYFQLLLTGVKMQEYTMATTGQLINPKTFDWDYELIDMLGYNKEIFQEVLCQPDFGSVLLRGLHAHGIHTAMESMGCAEFSTIERFLENLDLYLMDIKHMEPAKQKAFMTSILAGLTKQRKKQ